MLTIVIFHCDLPPTGGFVALDSFFVISGYVIGGLLIREMAATGRIRFSNFYLRRIRRLMPALAVMLVVVALMSAMLESPFTSQRTTSRIGVYAAFSLANLGLYRTDAGYFAEQAETIALRHTWSLSVEEQFYLVFPLVVAVALWGGRRRLRTLTAALLAVSLLSFALLVVMATASDLPVLHNLRSAAYYLPMTRMWEMAAGVAVAIWHLSRPPWTTRTARRISVAGAVGLGVAVVVFESDTDSSSPALVLPVVSTAILLAACRTPGGIRSALSWRPLCWVGDRSYGWYLWHWPLIVFARNEWPDNVPVLLLAAATALGVSTLTYHFVEQRFRYPRPDTPHREQVRSGVRIGLVCVAAGASATAALGLAAERDWGSSAVRTMAAQLTPRTIAARPGGCPVTGVSRSDSVEPCTFGTGPNPPVYLLGDSNGGQFRAGLILAGEELTRPVIDLTRSGCSYADTSIFIPGLDTDGCDEHNERVIAWLLTAPRGTVMVGNAGEYVNAAEVAMRDPAARSPIATTLQAKAQTWRTGLTRALQALGASGHEVMVLGMLPHPGGVTETGDSPWNPRGCGLVRILVSQDSCAISVSLRAEDRRQSAALQAEELATMAASAHYLDLRATVCPGGTCATRKGGQWIYYDSQHLTELRSSQLAPDFVEALTETVPTRSHR